MIKSGGMIKSWGTTKQRGQQSGEGGPQ
jgi:hypothetical protein